MTPTDVVMWAIGVTLLILIVWGSAATLASGRYSAYHWFDFVVFGLAQGSIYALIAMGYTMVYGTLRMINFAHSEVFMSGPYTAYFVAAAFYSSGFLNRHPILSLLAVFLVSMATSTLIAVLLERIAYRPLRNAPRLVPLITAIGASFFLQYTFRGLYGSGFQAYPVVKILEGEWMLGAFRILKFQAVVIASAALMIFAAIEKVAKKGPDGALYIGRKQLRDALYATKNLKGLTGNVSCDQYGDCADPRIAVYKTTEENVKKLVMPDKPFWTPPAAQAQKPPAKAPAKK